MRCNLLIIFLLIFSSCKKKSIKLNYLDEHVVGDSILFKNNMVGGLSGIDYSNNKYYMVVDDSSNPRIFVSKIAIEQNKISTINFIDVISVKDSTSLFFKNNALDLESVFIDNENNINLTSEGNINGGKRPSIFVIDSLGKFKKEVRIPSYFKNIDFGKPKHNAAFESSTKSIDKSGFWVAMEGPLGVDGEEPTFEVTSSPIRISYFDSTSNKATKQYAYQLEKIDKPAKGNINLNGVTAILQYTNDSFFVVERIYQSGYGSHGNTVRIFKATVQSNTTNTLEIQSLKKEKFISLKKELLFDFTSVKEKLTGGIIDNIEGITFGPTLPNGNQSLLLVSDDNFQKYGKQLNQFILLEIVNK
ncbi:esterase-like activity of phytase family protein [Tenacibaculum halocynthiae]|uniref:esterase-like activity of phytase family protein n=1 Tax=Tenacibaculum halocynthiae TaxID=1254437 RepID=UPI003D661BB2